MMKKRLIALLTAAALCLALTACAPQFREGNFKFTDENFPKFGGSLACLPYGEALTATALGIDRAEAAKRITFDGSTTSVYERLADGTFDIVLAYPPSDEARELVKEKGAELEMQAVGRDALVFITSKENPVDSITHEEARAIYRGEITNWKELGGADIEIAAFQRNYDSGSQTLFRQLVLPPEQTMTPPTDRLVDSMIGLLEAVANYDFSAGALGYTVYYYLTNMEASTLDNAKLVAIDGVMPSNDTIQNGTYPLTNDFYAVIRADTPQDAPARILYNWICGPQGEVIAKNENYIAL